VQGIDAGADFRQCKGLLQEAVGAESERAKPLVQT
jgi:hypothetical protein